MPVFDRKLNICNFPSLIHVMAIDISVVFLDESPCPRGSSGTNLGYKSLSLSLDHEVLENCQGLARSLQTIRYVRSREVHKFRYRHRA